MVARGYGEAAALENVELGEVEAEDMQHVVSDHVLGVVTQEVVGSARDADAGREEPLLELAQPVFAPTVGVRDQRTDADASLDRRSKRALDLIDVEPKDAHIDRFLGFADRLNDRHDTRVWLDDEFHYLPFAVGFSFHSTAPLPVGTSAVMALDTRSVCSSIGAITIYDTSSSD